MLPAEPGPPPGSAGFESRLRAAGDVLRQAGVAAVYQSHGTFAGTDVLGMFTELGRWLPNVSTRCQHWSKCIVDAIAGDVGNYPAAAATQLQSTWKKAAIPVRRLCWSSENHHLGRADGAVRIIDELASHDFKPGDRVLLLGHSHAGNAFALVSNLLAGLRSNKGAADGLHAENVARFFEAGQVFYQSPITGHIDLPHWQRVRDLLLRPRPILDGVRLDFVTLGTPIRYGWDSLGYDGLLHFVNHHSYSGLPDYRAPFPPNWDDVFGGSYGDFIQQLGIAGSNNPPAFFAYRAYLADRRLGALLQQGVPSRGIVEALRAGQRVPEEGTTLLCDYGPPQYRHVIAHLAGHGVYTRFAWMPFHLQEIAHWLYERDASGTPAA